jgi:hypothetical protein
LPWSPDDAIETLWKRIREIKDIARSATTPAPISDGSVIELTLVAFAKSGVYDHDIRTWEEKDQTDQTWTNFKTHFEKHEKLRRTRITAKAAGFHGANRIPAVSPLPVKPPTQPPPTPLQTISQQRRRAVLLLDARAVQDATHTSAACTRKGEVCHGDSTIEHRMGGSSTLIF